MNIQESGSFDSIESRLAEIANTRILVGIPQDNKEANSSKYATNAQKLYYNSKGSPARNIPARPVIEPAIEDKFDKISEKIREGAIKGLEGDMEGFREDYEMAGLMANTACIDLFKIWASEFEHIFEEIVKKDNVSWNIAGLTQKANVSVLKLFGLDTIATATAMGRSNLKSRLEATNAIMNNQGLLVLGESDEFQNFQYGFAGLGECYDRFMMDISGACEIPVTKLFGRSPAGMNATGESDLSNYYEMITRRQESILRPIYDKLFPIIFLSVCGFIPDDLDYSFKPLRIPSEEEKASLTNQYTGCIIQAYQAGLISQKTAMKELRQVTEITGAWSNISDEEIEKASEEFASPESEEANPFAGQPQEEQLPF